MKLLSDLFSDLTGWLTVGINVFMLVMMAYLFHMFVTKATHDD